MKDSVVYFDQIKKVLPHRYPFLLIDRVLKLEEGHVQALKNVTANEPFFIGHFPELAVMPGVLQIEAMAQAAGLMLALKDGFDTNKEVAFLAGIDEAKFKRVVIPGDQIIFEVKLVAQKKSVYKYQAQALVDNELASSALITLIIKPKV